MYADWDNAPEWAMWHAIDEDGSCWWHEKKPIKRCEEWTRIDVYSKCASTGSYHIADWEKSLEQRSLTYTDQINAILDNQIKKGKSKYGVTLEDGTLDVLSTVDHALEEICDLAFYLIHVRETLKGDK